MSELIPDRNGKNDVCPVFRSYQLLSRAKPSRLNEQLAGRLKGEKIDEVHTEILYEIRGVTTK